MYTESEYLIARDICAKAESALRANWPNWRKGGAIPESVTRHPDYMACNNAMRGKVEQYELLRDKPEKIFAYLDSDMRQVTTWTGDVIGKVTCVTGKWRIGGFTASHMYAFRAVIDGVRYHGRGMGGGMYCRLTKCK